MRTPPAPPFLRPSSDAIRPGPWTDEALDPLPDRLDDWDPYTDLSLERELVIDLQRVREESGLGRAATLAVVATWTSSSTRLSGGGPAVELGSIASPVRVEIGLGVPGRRAGGVLTIRTALVLRAPDPGAPPIVARRPGSVLWSDARPVQLEGSAARFPVTAVRFSALPGLPDAAAWVLDWRPEELDEPATSALRLLINADREDVVAALRTGGAAPGAEALRSFVRLDVARALIHAALRSDLFVGGSERWDEESLGRLLVDLVGRVWPGIPPRTLATRLADDPARIDGEIQAAFPPVIA